MPRDEPKNGWNIGAKMKAKLDKAKKYLGEYYMHKRDPRNLQDMTEYAVYLGKPNPHTGKRFDWKVVKEGMVPECGENMANSAVAQAQKIVDPEIYGSPDLQRGDVIEVSR
jgi:hypothetical protein